MSEGIKTVQGGRRRVPKTPPPKPKWIWPVIGLIVGIITLIIWQQCSVPAENELQPTPVSLEFETSPDLKVFPVKDNDTLPWKNIRSLRLLNSSDEVAFDRETGEVFLCEESSGLVVTFEAIITVDGADSLVRSSVNVGSFEQDYRAICGADPPTAPNGNSDKLDSEDIVIKSLGNCRFGIDIGKIDRQKIHVGLNGPLSMDLPLDSYSIDDLLDQDKWNIYVSINHGNPIPADANGSHIDRESFGCKRRLSLEEIEKRKYELKRAIEKSISQQPSPFADEDRFITFMQRMQDYTGQPFENIVLYTNNDRYNGDGIKVHLMTLPLKEIVSIKINYDDTPVSIHVITRLE